MVLKTFKKEKTQRVTTRRDARQHSQKTVSAKLRRTGLLLGLFWLITVAIFYLSGHPSPKISRLAPGQHAPETVVAAVNFSCENIAQTKLRENQAQKSVIPVFRIDPAPLRSAERTLTKLFSRLEESRKTESENHKNALKYLDNFLSGLDTGLTKEAFEPLINAATPLDEIQSKLRSILKTNLLCGISSRSDKIEFRDLASEGKINIYEESGSATTISASDIKTPSQAIAAATAEMNDSFGELTSPFISKLAARWLQPNLKYDADTTEKLRNDAKSQVKAATQIIPAGTTLIEAGDKITKQTFNTLRCHLSRLNKIQSTYERAMMVAGNAILLLAVLMATVGAFRVTGPKKLLSSKNILVLITTSLITLVVSKLLLAGATQTNLIPSPLAKYLLPHAFGPMLTTVLLGSPAGLAIGLWNSLAVAILFDHRFSVFVLGLIITLISVYMVRDAKRRSTLVLAGMWVSLTSVVFVLTAAILNRPALYVLGAQAGTAIFSGIVTAFAVIIAIPLFEAAFKITTDIKLLELSDMGHPLLRRLAIEAPGTYHHSLMVATLAQHAAERIGANALQVRTCAYFHDIGKLVKPGFFAENIQHIQNPHDELTPSMSTLVITAHIKEGLEIAKRYRLPKVLRDAISQHHGTSMVSYFYHRAKSNQNSESGAVEDCDYRYPGPKPNSVEQAILSLADPIEAASRSLEKITPTRIANLVEKIVAAKLKDEQLNNSDLTLTQLNQIKESFKFTLTNMRHVRIPYPDDENNSKKQSQKTSSEKGSN